MSSPLLPPPLTLQAQAGQPVDIVLTAMPGAGMLWQAPPAPAGCTLTEGDMQPASVGVGGPARQRFILTCPSAGERVLQFSFKRPWEAEVRAVQGVTVQVR